MKIGYKMIAGSKMYGTSTPTSDLDLRGFFYPSREDLLGLTPPPESKVVNSAEKDEAFWEFRHYIKMCMQANPNVLETLFAHSDCLIEFDHNAQYLRDTRSIFLSKRIGRTYMGYAAGNYKRCFKPDEAYDGKDAMHMIRLVRTGQECLETGYLNVRRLGDIPYFLDIKAGKIPAKELKEEFEQARGDWESFVAKSALSDEPPFEIINSVVIDIMSEIAQDS